jgi:hypothetical protein
MIEEVQPDEELVNYFSDSKSLWTDFDGNRQNFLENEEWHYVLSNIEANIFLLKRLDERGLLKNNNKICDCGIGLGVALFDIYRQSKSFIDDKTFEFFGIEKEKNYCEFLNQKLIHYWSGNLTLIEDDIMNQNYSNYNIVYTYTPFKTTEKLKVLYNKIISEIEPGSLLIENKNSGLGFNQVLLEIDGIKKIELDDIVVFQKI